MPLSLLTFTNCLEGLASLWVIPVAILAIVIGLPLYNIFLHPLRSYPGPLSWRMSRLAWHMSVHRGDLHAKLHEMHQKYGHVIRIAPDELSYTHPAAWNDIYNNRKFERTSIWFSRPTTLKTSEASPETIMFDEADHARFRRSFNSAFTETGLRAMYPTTEKYVSLLISKLSDMFAGDNDEVEIEAVKWLNMTTFDIGGDLVFGEAFGSVKSGEPHPWVRITTSWGKGVGLGTSMNFLKPLNELLGFIVPKTVRERMKYHQDLTKEKVDKRLDLGHERPDFLASVEKYNADMQEKSPSKVITREELYFGMNIVLFAASETTASALSAALRYILKDSNVQKRLTKEIREAYAKSDDISVSNIAELEYLTAVINETLRLAPPVVIGVPRVSPPGGDIVAGRWVPPKTLLAVNQYSTFRSASNFKQPAQFMPDRFLSAHGSSKDNMEAFQPFGAGRYQCIGYRMAWAVMRLILAQLIFNFDLSLVQATQYGDFGNQKSYLFWEKEPLMLKLKMKA